MSEPIDPLPPDDGIETSAPRSAVVSSPGPADAPDPLLGRCLDDTYLIEGVLGEGGMGRVYRARHTRIRQKEFAIKVLHPEYARDAQQLARFQREAEAAATISHPNVVSVFDVGRTTDGYSYLACELLHGNDLDEHVEKLGKLSVAAAVSIAVQICDALVSAHGLGVVHRDLKPQNVFLLAEPDGKVSEFPRVKVVDFGLSRFLDHTDSQLTKTGVVMGTPAFMAPEQATGLRGDHRVDVYGIGVILYTALTGRAPFEEDTVPATLLAVMIEEAPRPRSINADVPETLELVIQRAMAKKPEDRYPSVRELKSALEAFLVPGALLGGSGKSTKTTVLHLVDDAYELKTSRPRLLFLVFVASAVVVMTLGAGLSGLELVIGPIEFTRSELVLATLGVLGTLGMPLFLVMRRAQKTIWSNSAKVVDLVQKVRGPVTAALVAGGFGAVFLRFLDDFVSRVAFPGLLGRTPGLGWAGYTWLLPAIMGLAALQQHFARKWTEGNPGHVRRALVGPPLVVLTAVIALGLTVMSLEIRRSELAEVDRAALAAALAATPPQANEIVAAPLPAEPPPPPPPPARASDEELTRAALLGQAGLLPLSEKYPSDPRVLEPLLLTFASRATGYADAMSLAERLLAVAPEYRSSAALGLIVRKSAETPGQAAEAAFALLTGALGSDGADLLYQLSLGESAASERAKEALRRPEVLASASPALRIALDLRGAESCEARLPLLERAKALGDQRAALVLSPLAQGTKVGCGKWKRSPCLPECKDQSKEYLEVVKHIQARGKSTSL